MMVGFDSGDLWWVALSAFVAGMAGALALAVRAGLRKLARKAREGFVEWFGEAINNHVSPKFDELRVETKRVAEVLEQRTLATAAASEQRTGELIRAQVEPLKQTLEERTPIFDHLESVLQETQDALRGHIAQDEQMTAEVGQQLVDGQERLMGKIRADREDAARDHTELDIKVDALDGVVHDHIDADVEAFAKTEQQFAENKATVEPIAEAVHRIEQRLDTDRPDQPATTPADKPKPERRSRGR